MKKNVYIALFIFLGILFQFLVHAVAEMYAIGLLTGDFERYGLGLSWDAWFLIHHVATGLLFIAGALAGYWQGRRRWRVLYGSK